MSKQENNEYQSSGIAPLDVGQMTQLLGEMYAGAIQRRVPFGTLPAIMLWGKPGVGKSQGIRAVAHYIQTKTGKRVAITDVRLLLFNPIDLRGIPTADSERRFAVWLKPKIFAMDEAEDVVNILFLDEISAAPPSVQAAAYQITLDRVVGEHRLPDNCLVVAAGNRVSDRSVAYKMPKALANRLCHIEVVEDYHSWALWAQAAGLDHRVQGFLANRRDALCTYNPENEDVAYATPRSWEMVSNILLGGCYSSPQRAYPLLAGCVGEGLATEFCTWCDTHAVLPDIDRVVRGDFPPIPQSVDALYATSRLMTAAAGDCSDMVKTRNLVLYALRMPPDFTACFFRELFAKGEQVKARLLRIAEFTRWVTANAKYFR